VPWTTVPKVNRSARWCLAAIDLLLTCKTNDGTLRLIMAKGPVRVVHGDDLLYRFFQEALASQPELFRAVPLSQAGFDGGSETRILSWREETLRGCHDQGSIPTS